MSLEKLSLFRLSPLHFKSQVRRLLKLPRLNQTGEAPMHCRPQQFPPGGACQKSPRISSLPGPILLSQSSPYSRKLHYLQSEQDYFRHVLSCSGVPYMSIHRAVCVCFKLTVTYTYVCGCVCAQLGPYFPIISLGAELQNPKLFLHTGQFQKAWFFPKHLIK